MMVKDRGFPVAISGGILNSAQINDRFGGFHWLEWKPHDTQERLGLSRRWILQKRMPWLIEPSDESMNPPS